MRSITVFSVLLFAATAQAAPLAIGSTLYPSGTFAEPDPVGASSRSGRVGAVAKARWYAYGAVPVAAWKKPSKCILLLRTLSTAEAGALSIGDAPIPQVGRGSTKRAWEGPPTVK